MSEEKLYAIKNDEGEWADTRYIFGYGAWVTPDKTEREEYVKHHGGHVVTLIEEPEKVVLTKEQAALVERAHEATWPAYYITQRASSSDEEKLIMEAYANGFTVEKETKYNVKVPHTEGVWYYKSCNGNLMTICQLDKRLQITFTEEDIEHYGLQDCEKEEVTDDGN